MIETQTTPEIALLEQLLEIGHNTSVNIHGFTPAELAERMASGELDELRRDTQQESGTAYLVGKVKLGRIAFALFSDDLPSTTESAG